MYFTQNDFLKIYEWIKRHSIRDSEFEESTIIEDDDTVTVVTSKGNRKIKIKALIEVFIDKITGGDSSLVTKEELDRRQYITSEYVDTIINDLIGAAPETLNTLEELAEALKDNDDIIDTLEKAISNKADRSELPSLEGYATEEFVENKGYLTEHQDISGKQDNLVSGTNIKTINNQSILGEGNINISSSSVTSIAGTLNIKDLNAVKAAQELLSNNQQVTYIITDSNGNYPSPNNQTVYLDTEDNILDLLYRGNGDALKWLLKNKQAYYNYSGSWYSQTISEDLVKLPSLHLRTAQVGDLITLIRQDIPAEEFYSNFVDYNNINLNLGTTEKLAFDAYLTFVGIKGALESISDGEAIRRLVEGGYIYTAENNPEEFPETIMNPLVSSDGGLVTLYTAQITPNTQHLYNGEFWTGNMTGAGMYSYINNPDPAIPDRENGEVYTGYVSPDGTQTLVSMKNPFKAYKKVNNVWEKLETDTNYKTRYGWGTSLDSMLKTGVCAYTPATVAGMDANWTIFVTCSSDGDPTYYHLMQTAICRNDDKLGRIFQRMGWYKGNGEDLHFTDWKEVGGGSSDVQKFSAHGELDIATDTFELFDDIVNLTPIGVVAVYNSKDDSISEIALSLIPGSYIVIKTIDYCYDFTKNEDGEWVLDMKTPNYSERFATKDEVATAIANAITNTLNTEV